MQRDRSRLVESLGEGNESVMYAMARRRYVHDLHIRVVDAASGELLREPILDPTKDYQPTGRPPGPRPKRSS
ncbi:hypothetical protein ACXC9Q_29835 [Kribbella sp. CWNU-51]